MEYTLNLDEYKWKHRLLLIFAKNPEDPIYQWQQREINENSSGIRERQIMMIRIFSHGQSMLEESPLPEETAAQLHRQFNIKKNRFTIVLMGKDGEEKYRDDKPVAFEDIFSIIDSLPLRKKELKEKRLL